LPGGQHGFAWKYAPYEANLRAPLLVRLPGKVAAGKVCRRPVGGVPWYVFLREGRYKYIRTLEPDEVEELYDLEADPEELVNLAYDPAHRARPLELREKLLAELRRTKARFVEHLPEPRLTPR